MHTANLRPHREPASPQAPSPRKPLQVVSGHSIQQQNRKLPCYLDMAYICGFKGLHALAEEGNFPAILVSL